MNPGFGYQFVRCLAGAAFVFCLAAVAWSAMTGGLVSELVFSGQTAAWKLERLQQFFADCGPFAPAVYFLLVTVEVVVAPVPGLMLYAPGGVLFGGFQGGAIALAGNVAGAGIACQAARTVGSGRISRYLTSETPGTIREALRRRGGWVIFLLRLNPLTSSDLVSYAAGFTQIPVWKVMLATLGGMAPLCFAQAYLAENLLVAFPDLIYCLSVLCAIYILVVVRVGRRLVSEDRCREHTAPRVAVSSAATVSGETVSGETVELPVE